MCVGPEPSSAKASTVALSSFSSRGSNYKEMSTMNVKSSNGFSIVLELAANNDLDGMKEFLEHDVSSIDEIGLWYCRNKLSRKIVLDHRTPLMVAATYGSVDVLKLILSSNQADVNLACGIEKTTALHCATSSGSPNTIDAVQILLSAGANPNAIDANGNNPVDVIVVPPKSPTMRSSLEELILKRGICNTSSNEFDSNGSSPPSPTMLACSPPSHELNNLPATLIPERKEYPIDPSLPDIKDSIYSTDEFRMFSFKVRPCSRAYSHDWTECPFVHPGENARRRDPRKFHYSCVPCPDFRKGACRRGDMCEYAHGVFECWLHPAQYRTRLCKDGTSCSRRVCFFAHASEELRPLYVSTGSAVPSPRSTSAASANPMDLAAALSLLPGSPSSVAAMSPATNGISHQSLSGWPHPNIPSLHLPSSHLQSSRLRSSFNARDDFHLLSDFDPQKQMLNDLGCLSQCRSGGWSKTMTPSNLEDLFSSETSPPNHKSSLLSSFSQQQPMLSPINTGIFSPKNMDHPLLQASFGVASPGRMSPRSIDPASPLSSRLCTLAHWEKLAPPQQLRTLGSAPFGSWSKFGRAADDKVDWAASSIGGDLLDRSADEPDLSWVQSLVKDSPPEFKKENSPAADPDSHPAPPQPENLKSEFDTMIESWLEQMQLDQQLVVK